MSKVVSKSKNDTPYLLRRTTLSPYFHPLFSVFQIPPPSEGRNQNLLPPLKGWGGSELWSPSKGSI